MDIVSLDGTSRLSIDKIEDVAVEGQEPTAQFTMLVKSEDFEGKLKSAWIDKEFLEAFVKEAESLVQSRGFKAKLSPHFSQFSIGFEKSDNRGHLICSSNFHKKQGGSSITVNFETDVTYLEQLRVYFQKVVNQLISPCDYLG